MNKILKYTAGLLMLAGTLLAHPKISPDLEKVPRSSQVDVIVRYRSPLNIGQENLLTKIGALLKSELKLIQSVVYTVTRSQVESLAADPDVEYISPDRTVKNSLDYANPAVNANLAFSAGFTGQGIGVAVIDSGIQKKPDLDTNLLLLRLSRVVYNESFVKGDKRFEDMYGHGTHVAGILGGDGEKSTGSAYTRTFRGIAPGVHQINLRVLDANGVGTDSAIIAAIERAIQLKLLYNIRVINLSVGRPVYESHTTDPLCQAVEQAWKAGIVVVVAAGNEGRNNTFGNEGYGTIMSPANDPYVITVGSMKDMSTTSRGDDQIASYSSKGPTSIDHVVKPDIVAPGNRIVSLAASGNIAQASSLALNLVPQSYYQRNGSSTAASSDYYMLSGTSMAAPMVSGAAALLIQKRPNLTPDQVKAILMKTATKTFPAMSVTYDSATNQTFTSRYDIFTIGAGYLMSGGVELL